MSHLDLEIKRLKAETVEMFELVTAQMNKTYVAFSQLNREIAREVNFNEKRVNALELKIDKDCENLIALFNPLAIDLRFVLAVLKINSNLERIGDIADGISRYVFESEHPFDQDLLAHAKIDEMFRVSIEMLKDVMIAFDHEDTKAARTVFQKDDLLDAINGNANRVLEEQMRKDPDLIRPGLHIISTIRKLERTGDQVKNIAEEIIFFIEAKVLKHLSTSSKVD